MSQVGKAGAPRAEPPSGEPLDLVAPANPPPVARPSVDGALALALDLSVSSQVDDVGAALLHRAVNSVDADGGALCRFVEGDVIAGPVLRGGRVYPRTIRARMSELPALRALRHRPAAPSHDLRVLSLLPPAAAAPLRGLRRLAVVPIVVDDVVTAVVLVGRRRNQPFAAAEVEGVRLIGSVGLPILNTVTLRDSAEEASQTKSNFLSMAAHEMRTPLGVVSGYLSMLRDGTFGEVPSAWEGPLTKMGDKLAEMGDMVDDLLVAARLQAGAMPVQAERFDLGELVNAAVARATPRGDLLGAALECSLSDTPVEVEVDRQQIGRVLDNLINNALTYSQGSPWVSLHVWAEGGVARVRVSDRGVGIPEAMMERIFERYRRGGPAAGSRPGTGLGLAIARETAELNGGSLILDHSVVGEGSRFLLELPCAGT